MIDYHDDPRWRAAWTCEGCHNLFFDWKTSFGMEPKVLHDHIWLCNGCYARRTTDEETEL